MRDTRMRKSQTRLRPAGAAGRARERGAGRWRRAEGRRSVGGVAGSDTQVPAAPEAPSPANRGPELGAEVGGRAGESALFPRDAGQWVGKGHMGPGPPKSPPRPTQEQVSGSLLLLESGFPPSPPHPPWWVSSKANSSAHGRGQRPRPAAPRGPLPAPQTKARRGEMAGAVDVKVTDPFIKGGKKAKIQKKKNTHDGTMCE